MEQPKEKVIEEAVALAFDSVLAGVSLAQQKKISPDEIEALYVLGANYYSQKNFAKAEEIFSYALPFDFFHLKLIMGLAATRKMLGKYEDGLKAYALAGLLDMENPEPSFYAAECFFALGQVPQCREALDAALGLAQGEPKYKKLCTQIKKMKANLKEQANV